MIAERLAEHGLSLRGGFNFSDREDAPPAASGEPARAVLLVGNFGARFWPHFERWRAAQSPAPANPLDTWSRLVIGVAAQEAGARLVMPNDRPFPPFQQWAMRAEGLRPSPLGILMHPRYGLWHAYRAALLLDDPLPPGNAPHHAHPCDECLGKPCLTSCPVEAYGPQGFAYAECLEHVRGSQGRRCLTKGCLDRNACPVGVDYRYPADVQQFFMKAFVRAALSA